MDFRSRDYELIKTTRNFNYDSHRPPSHTGGTANNQINSGEAQHERLKASLVIMNHESIFVFTEMQTLVGWT